MTATTRERIEAIVRQWYDKEQRRLDATKYIQSFLSAYDGKKITKHITNALQKKHPDWCIRFYRVASMTYLMMWGGSTGVKTSDQAFRFFLSYNDIYENSTFFDKNSIKYMEERQAKRVLMLGNDQRLVCLAAVIDQFNLVKAQLKEYMSADWVEDGSTIHKELINDD